MNKKVCVAMSGGVDSSVAAALLQKQGYEVIGAFMKNWSLDVEGQTKHYKPWEDEANDAEAVCKLLGIPFHIFDFEKEYRERVVDYFVDQYKQGRTPNPDVLCNREIKFDLFLKKAQELGSDLIATGHYAQVKEEHGKFALYAGKDTNKDQSYFLYTLGQAELAHVLFPIGDLYKSEVRDLAKQFNLPNAAKKDSQGICFIGPVSMRQFLQQYIDIKPGNVVTADGEVLGKHDGVMFYTEGQRHGFDTKGSHVPLYVAQKNLEKNELVVVPHDHPLLYTKEITLQDETWTSARPTLPMSILARVRYRQALHKVELKQNGQDLVVTFDQPIAGVSSGQSAVLYDSSQVLGGGVIV